MKVYDKRNSSTMTLSTGELGPNYTVSIDKDALISTEFGYTVSFTRWEIERLVKLATEINKEINK